LKGREGRPAIKNNVFVVVAAVAVVVVVNDV